MKITTAMRAWAVRLILCASAAVLSISFTPAAIAAVIPDGTIMVSTGSGKVSEYTQDGTLITQLDTGTGSTYTTGSGFDANGNFFVTDFSTNAVTKFDPSGSLIGPFGSGYNGHPESIIFAGQNVFVGQPDGTHQILEFNSAGTPVAAFSPAIESRGTDWIALDTDGCTMFYTSEGAHVKRYNICTNTQLADFNSVPFPNVAYAFKLLPTGGLIVADTSSIIRLDASGHQIQTYTIPNVFILFALNLDPDASSFWTADYHGEVYKVDIASGVIQKHWSATGAPGFTSVAGLSEKEEIQPVINGQYDVTHFDVNAGDGTVRLINPTTTSDGMLCAMIYVFDAHEELQECCGCPVTNNGLRTISTLSNLTPNPLTGAGTNLKTGVIKMVTTAINGSNNIWGICNPGVSYNVDAVGLRAWSTHTFAVGGSPQVTEEGFIRSPLSSSEIGALTSTCAYIHMNGSGNGICTCGTGDFAPPKAGGSNR